MPQVWEMYHCLYLICGIYIYQVWEIHHGLLITGGIYRIFSTQVAINENFSPTDLWNIIITCTHPLGNVSLSPPHLWERHQCLHYTYAKCFIISTSLIANASFSQPNLWECFIVSTPNVRNASFPLQKKFGYVSLSLLLL